MDASIKLLLFLQKHTQQSTTFKPTSTNALIPMFENKSKDWQEQSQQLATEGIYRFRCQNDIYKITCSYLNSQNLEFRVESNKTIEFYSVILTPRDIEQKLNLHCDIERLYRHLEANPSLLTFQPVTKYLLIQDIQGRQRLIFKQLQVKQQVLSKNEYTQIQLQRAKKKISNLQFELRNAKSQIVQLKQQVSLYQNNQSHMRREIQDWKQVVKKVEKKFIQQRSQNIRLENKLGFYEAKDERDEDMADIIQKKHRHNEYSLTHDAQRRKEHFVKPIIEDLYKDAEQSTAVAPIEQATIQHHQPKEDPQYEDQIFGQKLNVCSYEQRNSQKYHIDGNKITKVSGVCNGHIYFFRTERPLLYRTLPCWLSIKNLSPASLRQNSSYSIILGITVQANLYQLECQSLKEALYLDGIQKKVYSNKVPDKIDRPFTFEKDNVFTMVVNMQGRRVAWYMNNVELRAERINWGISNKNNVVAFMQMNGKTSKVVIL